MSFAIIYVLTCVCCILSLLERCPVGPRMEDVEGMTIVARIAAFGIFAALAMQWISGLA